MQVVPLRLETPIVVENLDAMVFPVGDIDPSIRIAGNVVRKIDCPGPEPGSPHDMIRFPSGAYLWMRALP